MRAAIVPLITVAVIGVITGVFLQSQGFFKVAKNVESATLSSRIGASPVHFAETENLQIRALADQLAAEIEARKALQESVDSLSRQLAQLIQASPSAEQANSGAQRSASTPNADRAWFNEQALIDVGVDVTEANRIKAAHEQLELERLYVRDQASREGWNRLKRREALQSIELQQQALEAEIGDDAYDAYLYASGQPNRVEIQSVLAGSAAAIAGIQDGDYILRYGDQRVYSGQDLRGATAQGTADELIGVSIERDNTKLEVYVPRGPLGVRMSSASVAP
jgi:vacuolar-type H+-ATPase subunit I/STV1